MAPNRSFGFFFFFCQKKRASSIQKSRGKKISKISLIARTNFFSLSLPSFRENQRENCLTTHRAKRTPRFFFGLRSVRLLRALYIKRERQLSRVDTPTERKRIAEESFPLARTLAFYCFKVEIKNSKTERERGVLLRREFKKIQEKRATKKSYCYYYY